MGLGVMAWWGWVALGWLLGAGSLALIVGLVVENREKQVPRDDD